MPYVSLKSPRKIDKMVISEDVSVQVVLRKNMGLTKPLITYIFTIIIIIIIIDITFTPR